MRSELFKNIFFGLGLVIIVTACGGSGSDDGTQAVVITSEDTRVEPLSDVSDLVVIPDPVIIPDAPLSNEVSIFILAGELSKTTSTTMLVEGVTHYSVLNLPSWISLNESTGKLTMYSDGTKVGHEQYDVVLTKDGADITITKGLRVSIYKPYNTLSSQRNLLDASTSIKTGGANKTTSSGDVHIITNADGINHTAITYYFEKYNINGRLTAIDVATDSVKNVITENEMTKEGWNGSMMVPLGNGRAMFAFNKAGYQEVAVYDTNKHGWDRNIVAHPTTHKINVMNAITYSTGGQVFTLGVNAHDGTAHPTLLSIDPDTYETRFYGNIGEGGWFGQQIAADRTYVYVLSGREPYRITQVRISDGQQTSIATGTDLWLRQYKGGVLIGYAGKSYFMHNGVKYEKLSGQTSANAPWPKVAGECVRTKCYNVNYDQKFIVAFDRHAVTPLSGKSTGYYWYQDTYQGPWKKLTTPNIPLYNVDLVDMVVLPEVSKIFYAGDRYSGYLLQDLNDKSFDAYNLVDGLLSYYAADYSYPYLAFTGYPNGETVVYDVRYAWDNTLPGSMYHPQSPISVSNPRNIGHMNVFSGTHKNYAIATGQDELLYFGGKWMRDGVGGGVEWYNLETGIHGGIRSGFEDVWVTQMKAVGKYIALGCTKISGSSTFEIRMLNTLTKNIDYVIKPDTNLNTVGLWTKYGDENILIYTRTGEGNAAILNVNVIENRVVYNRDLGVVSNVANFVNAKEQANIFIEEGFAYINVINSTILRIEPSTGDAEVILKHTDIAGKILGYKNVLFLTGKETKQFPLTLNLGFEEADKREELSLTSVNEGNENLVLRTTSTSPFNIDASLTSTSSSKYKNSFYYDNSTIMDNDYITLIMTIESISGGDIVISSVEYNGGASALVKAGEKVTVELTVRVLGSNNRLRVEFDLPNMTTSQWTMRDIHIKKEL